MSQPVFKVGQYVRLKKRVRDLRGGEVFLVTAYIHYGGPSSDCITICGVDGSLIDDEDTFWCSRFELYEPKFKKGDHVLVIKNTSCGFPRGTYATVLRIADYTDGDFCYDLGTDNNQYFHSQKDLCIAEEKTTVFKKGDIVEIIAPSSGHAVGATGVITSYRGGSYEVQGLTGTWSKLKLMHTADTLRLVEPGKSVKAEEGTSWSFEITNRTQVDFKEVAAELTRKNPVAFVDDPENEDLIVVISVYLQTKLDLLDVPFPEVEDVKHMNEYSILWVSRKNESYFREMLKNAVSKPYPKEARRKVTVTLPNLNDK